MESGGSLIEHEGYIQLFCQASGFTLSGYWMHWICQAPGKGPEWLANIKYDGSEKYYAVSMKG